MSECVGVWVGGRQAGQGVASGQWGGTKLCDKLGALVNQAIVCVSVSVSVCVCECELCVCVSVSVCVCVCVYVCVGGGEAGHLGWQAKVGQRRPVSVCVVVTAGCNYVLTLLYCHRRGACACA